MEAEEKVAKVARAFARANDPWPGKVCMYLVEEEELYLGVYLDGLVYIRGHVDAEGLDEDGTENMTFFVPGGANKGVDIGVVAAELAEG